MTKALRGLAMCLLAWSGVALALTQTMEQLEVTGFMQKLYSYSANMFEGRIFNGKDNPQKQCVLLREFFSANVLTPEDSRWHGCDIVGNVFIRYPGLASEDFDIYGGPGAIKKPKLSVPLVDGDKASVSAVSEFGKTVYFLKRTDKGWRVENALYYDRVPTVVNACHGQFAKEPTSDQLKSLPPCKDY